MVVKLNAKTKQGKIPLHYFKNQKAGREDAVDEGSQRGKGSRNGMVGRAVRAVMEWGLSLEEGSKERRKEGRNVEYWSGKSEMM